MWVMILRKADCSLWSKRRSHKKKKKMQINETWADNTNTVSIWRLTCSSSSRTARWDKCDGCGHLRMKLCSQSSAQCVPPQLFQEQKHTATLRKPVTGKPHKWGPGGTGDIYLIPPPCHSQKSTLIWVFWQVNNPLWKAKVNRQVFRKLQRLCTQFVVVSY